MKKFFLVSMLLFALLAPSVAQDTSKKYEYCELVSTGEFESNFFSDSREKVKIDFGKKTTTDFFRSMIDAMNYMADKGWELVQVYFVVENNRNVSHWVLKRKI